MGVDEVILPKELDWSRTPLNHASESSWLQIDEDSLPTEIRGPNELFCFDDTLEGSLSCDLDAWAAELDNGTAIDPIEQMESGSWQWEDDATPSAPGLQERDSTRHKILGRSVGTSLVGVPDVLRAQGSNAQTCANRPLRDPKPISFGHLGNTVPQSKGRQEMKSIVKLEASASPAATKGNMVMHFANHPIRSAQIHSSNKHSLNANQQMSAQTLGNTRGSLLEKMAVGCKKEPIVDERAKRTRPLCITYCDGMSSSKDASFRHLKQAKVSEKLQFKARSYAPAKLDITASPVHFHDYSDSSVTVLPICKFVSKRVGTTCEHPPVKTMHKRGHLSVACSAGHQWVWCSECCNCAGSCATEGQGKRGCINPVHWFERDAFDTGKRNHMNRHRK